MWIRETDGGRLWTGITLLDSLPQAIRAYVRLIFVVTIALDLGDSYDSDVEVHRRISLETLRCHFLVSGLTDLTRIFSQIMASPTLLRRSERSEISIVRIVLVSTAIADIFSHIVVLQLVDYVQRSDAL